MNKYTTIAIFTLLLAGAVGLAAETAPRSDRVEELPPVRRVERVAAPDYRPARAPTDTVYLIGGPGQLSGKFQDAAGMPDRQGWIGVDLTQQTVNYWHLSTFNAANLDTNCHDNHAWWCGTVMESCYPEDPPEGYGDNWHERIEWTAPVADPNTGVTVRIKAVVNYDCDNANDFLELRAVTAGGSLTLAYFTYQGSGEILDESVTLTPADYVGEDSNLVHLRLVFYSDGGWSDEDCYWPSAGAAQVDLIEVFFDQGAGEVQIGLTETCEPGDPVQWRPILSVGAGDFSKVWPQLNDLDPESDNLTPQFAFIDDGIVVPGTGGTPCVTWCYGPDGYIVNHADGISDPGRSLINEIWSPPLAVPAGPFAGALLSYDVYIHQELEYGWPGVFPVWHVRSTIDPAGLTDWTEWRDRNDLPAGGPLYLRDNHNLTDLLVRGFTHVQVALGVRDYNLSYTSDGTPAPYFDNVALKVYEIAGPTALRVRPDGSGDYPTIQSAIDAAALQDTVLLADGIYTGHGNRDLDYKGKAVVVRSESSDPRACIIDCQGSASENHRCAYFYRGEGAGSVLAGVTARNGHTNSSGGGLAIRYGSSPTVENCIIEDCTVEGINNYGGGIYCQDSSPLIRDCGFRGNTASWGGAIAAPWDSHPIIERCLFLENKALSDGAGVMARYYESSVTITSCTFIDNTAPAGAGVIGGQFDAHVKVDRTIIAFNPGGLPVACSVDATAALTCCDIYGNSLGDWVGCISDQLGVSGNISEDPLFCLNLSPDDPYSLKGDSPCGPDANPSCGLIGNRPLGCNIAGTRTSYSEDPSRPSLHPNLPNPFNPRTSIRYELPRRSRVSLRVFDISGRLVRRLRDGVYENAGGHEVQWDGRNDSGRAVASGMYFLRLSVGGYAEIRRMMLIR